MGGNEALGAIAFVAIAVSEELTGVGAFFDIGGKPGDGAFVEKVGVDTEDAICCGMIGENAT